MEHVTVLHLVDRAARLTNFTVEDLLGAAQHREVCAVRCAIYMAARDRGYSLMQIGRRVGRHHTSVMNGLNKEPEYRDRFPQFDALVAAMRTGHSDYPLQFGQPRNGRIPMFWTPALMAKIDRQIRDGVRMADIAESLGRSHSALSSARKLWLQRRGRWKSRVDTATESTYE